MTRETLYAFRVEGMDCASCATKIETAARQIDGVSNVTVGVMSESLSATIATPGAADKLQKAVRKLGYRIAEKHGAAAPAAAPHSHDDHDGHDGHDHGSETAHSADDGHDHAAPIEGPWWQSGRGRYVLACAAVVAIAYGATQLFPQAAQPLFWLATAIGAFPVARRAWAALLQGSVFTIETLMTIAVIGALAIGEAEEAAVVVALFALGELLEGLAAGRARAGIKALAKVAPSTAMVEAGGGLVETPVAGIPVGAIVLVRPGDRVPADGTVLTGTSAVDEQALTGESVPRSKTEGDVVLAGAINVEAALRVRVDKPASDTVIARVIRLVEDAVDAKAPSQRFIDSFARWYMPIICLLAAAVVLVPPLAWQADWNTWIYRGLALLLIGCPCALVISTPAAIASSLAAGARRGILVKGGNVLEAIGKVRHIALDKTGTLTTGKPVVTDVIALPGHTEADLLSLAAGIEQGASHPLAVAIVEAAQERGLAIAAASSTVMPGKGVTGTIAGKTITVGAPGRLGVTDKAILSQSETLAAAGKSVAVVLVDGKPAGLIALSDALRPDAATGMATLKALGLRPIILTGDNAAAATSVGNALGVEVKAELLPEDKLAVIRERAKDGGIAKVGDGINDAPALAAATVGIAMGSGTDVALEAADAAILNNRIGDIADLVRQSRRTLAVIRQNVAIAMGLKAVFLVTTIAGLTGLWLAILADTGATVLVTLNALRLLAFRRADGA